MKRSSWIKVLLGFFIAVVYVKLFISHNIGPQRAESLSQPQIYAYKEWQSVGVQVKTGDRIDIRAEGRWLYTPGEYHGPEGHRRYLAPDSYPINAAAGGVLLGRIGENGAIFRVGKGRSFIVDKSGLLYFRINDDILSDNIGYVTIELHVTEAVVGE